MTSVSIDDLTGPRLVRLDLEAADRWAAIDELAGLLAADGRLRDPERFAAAVRAREEEGPTGMEMGVAIPHAKSEAVLRPAVAFGRSAAGIDFGAPDGTPADLLFLIAAPEGGADLHLVVLSRLARRLVHESFRTALREAATAEAAVQTIREEVEL